MATEMRLNNDYRKGLTKDFRKHAEQEDTPQKEEYKQCISDYDRAVVNAFWNCNASYRESISLLKMWYS